MKQEDFENKLNTDSTYNPNAGSVTMYQKGGILKTFNSLGEGYSFLPAGNSLVVGASPEADHLTIQAAVDAAAAGDHIIILRGSYNEAVKIRKKLFIIGESTEVILTGSIEFQVGSDNSVLTNMYVVGDITLHANTKMIRVLEPTQSFLGTFTEFPDHSGGNSTEGVAFWSVSPSVGDVSLPLDGVTDITNNLINWNGANPDQQLTHNGVGTTVLSSQVVLLRSTPARSNIYIILKEDS